MTLPPLGPVECSGRFEAALPPPDCLEAGSPPLRPSDGRARQAAAAFGVTGLTPGQDPAWCSAITCSASDGGERAMLGHRLAQVELFGVAAGCRYERVVAVFEIGLTAAVGSGGQHPLPF